MSLLLLVTQQMSLLHGYAHTANLQETPARLALAEPGTERGGKSSKPALHDLCAQCMASAQVAFALPLKVLQFVPVELAFNLLPAPRTPALCLLTVCVFQPRGPPQA
ncbi:hypothetical protein [Massilia horti]|uniref:DUF2946 domain-containing protein n=1 Tax=Massilia horti TaxID=2562153 RepID=A0A4Y9T468_9BURK|nr:hypothetical protein [Massilia horti]TFW32544.1 hypothetical protein E4O92_09540 [Massilia horti]